MKLRRLTGLERDKIQEELDGLRRAIAYYEDLLAHEEDSGRHQGRDARDLQEVWRQAPHRDQPG